MDRAVFLLSFLLLSVAWGDDAPKRGGTLVFGMSLGAVTLDPAKSTDDESNKVINHVFEGLVRYKGKTTEIEPGLATSWESNHDNTEWIFHIRPEVFFHDGTPLTADAVVVSIMRQIDPGHPYHQRGFSYSDVAFTHWEKVFALDAMTVKIVLAQPYGPFLSQLTMTAASIVSPDALRRLGNGFEQHPIGTGPFQFERWGTTDNQIVLKRNDRYWDRAAYLDRIVFKPVPRAEDRFLELKVGAIQVMDGLDPSMVNEVERNTSLVLATNESLNVVYLAMNVEKEPFGSEKVRMAINHAINKERLVKFVYQGYAIPAKGPLPPTIWGYHNELKDFEYDPEKARRLLTEAGHPNGFETSLLFVDRALHPKGIERILQANLEMVNIKVNIKTVDWVTFLSITQRGEHEMCLSAWLGDIGDPDNFFYPLLSKEKANKPVALNVSFYKNDSFSELIARAQSTLNKRERTKLYLSAQEMLRKQAVLAPLAHVSESLAHANHVHGITMHPLRGIIFHEAWIE